MVMSLGNEKSTLYSVDVGGSPSTLFQVSMTIIYRFSQGQKRTLAGTCLSLVKFSERMILNILTGQRRT